MYFRCASSIVGSPMRSFSALTPGVTTEKSSSNESRGFPLGISYEFLLVVSGLNRIYRSVQYGSERFFRRRHSHRGSSSRRCFWTEEFQLKQHFLDCFERGSHGHFVFAYIAGRYPRVRRDMSPVFPVFCRFVSLGKTSSSVFRSL